MRGPGQVLKRTKTLQWSRPKEYTIIVQRLKRLSAQAQNGSLPCGPAALLQERDSQMIDRQTSEVPAGKGDPLAYGDFLANVPLASSHRESDHVALGFGLALRFGIGTVRVDA